MFLRKTGAALGAALLTSAIAATGASAAGVTQVSCSNGVVTISGAASTTNVIGVEDAGAGKYKITDVGSGATVGYTVGGCLTGVSDYTSTHGTITVSGTITSVTVNGNDLSDVINTDGLAGKAAIYGGSGADILIGGGGNDTINGGSGDDSIDGGYGNDTITGLSGADDIDAGYGDDSIYEADGYADTIDGGPGNDWAYIDTEASVINVETLTF
ncbi:MAG: hypothetical protein J7513_14040 [Solirubrobacteraceae bacterium]|nr:hypothetical protein [Solirubrobacteraceae bacterium]